MDGLGQGGPNLAGGLTALLQVASHPGQDLDGYDKHDGAERGQDTKRCLSTEPVTEKYAHRDAGNGSEREGGHDHAGSTATADLRKRIADDHQDKRSADPTEAAGNRPREDQPPITG